MSYTRICPVQTPWRRLRRHRSADLSIKTALATSRGFHSSGLRSSNQGGGGPTCIMHSLIIQAYTHALCMHGVVQSSMHARTLEFLHVCMSCTRCRPRTYNHCSHLFDRKSALQSTKVSSHTLWQVLWRCLARPSSTSISSKRNNAFHHRMRCSLGIFTLQAHAVVL